MASSSDPLPLAETADDGAMAVDAGAGAAVAEVRPTGDLAGAGLDSVTGAEAALATEFSLEVFVRNAAGAEDFPGSAAGAGCTAGSRLVLGTAAGNGRAALLPARVLRHAM